MHPTFHVLNPNKYVIAEALVILLDEVQVNKNLYPKEEHVVIMDWENKRTEQS